MSNTGYNESPLSKGGQLQVSAKDGGASRGGSLSVPVRPQKSAAHSGRPQSAGTTPALNQLPAHFHWTPRGCEHRTGGERDREAGIVSHANPAIQIPAMAVPDIIRSLPKTRIAKAG
jgi:hypothetical protein